MVESIKHNMRQMLATSAQDAKPSTQRSGQLSVGSSINAAVSLDDSNLSIKSEISSLSKTPPIDIEVVSRIKQQIAAGQYPVNLDLVSERLMESYLEMKG